MPNAWMNTPKRRLELPPEAETARDFVEALVARYDLRIEVLQPEGCLLFENEHRAYERLIGLMQDKYGGEEASPLLHSVEVHAAAT